MSMMPARSWMMALRSSGVRSSALLRSAAGVYTRNIDSGIRSPFTVATCPGPSTLSVASGGELCVHAVINVASDAVINAPVYRVMVFQLSARLLGLVGGQRIHAERVNVRLHQAAEGSIYHAMPLQRFRAVELRGHDSHAEMASAVLRTGVARVPVAV